MDHLKSVILSLQSEATLLKSEVSLLRSKNGSLKAENSLLKSELDSLQSLTHSLKLANKSLALENCKLKDKLGLTSKNSSIPTSKELYKQKRNKVKSPRNRGGQPGHAGTTRSKLEADEVIELHIANSCSCGGPIAISAKPYYSPKSRSARN
ncbi:MAG: DUF6444 domain-containing protein [Candidatus Cardinium sp.]|uniref:DUF6444 domain-containing protein n=1 Tax=Candidatus Cardinium sp. TP TaxID=2961955 RepID=UPI0021B04E8B|nr:DUF6444 domain-containing protein [Candidatus Cardinium sp. TP]MCT4697301.1 DUF6444 domain-containing protein [Candidatus Cardinium sp. TP]